MPALDSFNMVTPERPIAVLRMLPQVDLHDHQHDNVELVVVTGGSGEHVTPDGAWTLARGDVFVIPVGLRHGYARCRELTLINIGYDVGRAALPEPRLARLPGYHALAHLEPRMRGLHEFASHLRLDESRLAPVLAGIDRLETELLDREPGHDLACSALLLQILVACSRCYAAAETPQARALVRLASLLAWIDDHHSRPMRVDDLARRGRMSKSTLTRQFRRCLGRAPLDYVLDVRLRHAAERLRAEDTPIAAIAEAVGFDDPNYFARRFRARHGCTPRAWRKAADQR